MFQKIKKWEWNDWLHLTCCAGLVITFILTTWWMTLLLWGYEWVCWWGWVAYERVHHPVALEQLFARMTERAEKK